MTAAPAEGAAAAEGAGAPAGAAIGAAFPRTEDARLLRGQGRFADDVDLPGQAYGAVLRSPHAHADIAAIDTGPARRAAGVLCVLAAGDDDIDRLGAIPFNGVRNRDGTPMAPIVRPVLARDRVRHVGEPVAFVVAESAACARDACELVEVDWRPLSAVVGVERAIAPGAAQLWPQAPGNVVLDWEIGDRAAVREALAGAAHVVELAVANNRVAAAPLEPRAAVAACDAGDGRLTLHVSSQGPLKLARPLADEVLKVPRGALRVLTGDVGGAFGMKNFLFHEYALALVAARRLGRPVKWTAERGESFVSDLQGRARTMSGRMAFDDGFRILGLEVDVLADFGAYVSQFMPFVATRAATAIQSMCYAVPALHTRVRGVVTNTLPVDAYRGAGRPETAFLVERLLDEAAHRFALAPAELRRRNHVRRFPHRTGAGFVLDGGDFARHLDLALRVADEPGFRRRRAASRARGMLRGFGLAGVFDRCGGGGPDMVELRIDPSGGALLAVGTQSNGQGHETAYTQIVADRLAIAPALVRVRQGDSDLVPYGSGNGGSNFVAVGASACHVATERAIAKGRRIAAHVLGAPQGEVRFDDGVFRAAGSNRALKLAEIAALDAAHLPAGEEPGFQVTGSFRPSDGPTFPNGTHICELEVDPETGAVTLLRYVAIDDFGRVVNPLLAAGQVHGGVAQGIGQALAEHAAYDEASGQLLAGSFMDYALPRAADLPPIETGRIAVATARNPLGAKGNGETGAIGAPPAVVNALLDALRPLGVRHIDMPATPWKVWRAIREARP